MHRRVLLLVLAFLGLAAAALAQEPANTVRRRISDKRVLAVTGHCFYGQRLDEAQAKRLCRDQVRGRLLDAAVSRFGTQSAVRGTRLVGRELRAFVDSQLHVETLDEESRPGRDGLAVRVSLQGTLPQESLTTRIADFLADGQLRASALAATADHDRRTGEARLASVPFEGQKEFGARPGEPVGSPATALATGRVVRGLSLAGLKVLLGNPREYRQSIIGTKTYVCAAYDRLWVVLEDGVVACARPTLHFLSRYGTDCHCFGRPEELIPLP